MSIVADHVIDAERRVVAFSAEADPAVVVEAGETILFRTVDTEAGRVRTEGDRVSLDSLDAVAEGISGGNPATGPVYVRGAQPGDVLAVDVLEIEVDSRGWVCVFPGVGPLRHLIETEQTWFFDVDGEHATRGSMTVPTRPMIGVIGVAPADGVVGTDFAGRHGGNLDDRYIAAGSRMYLPVNHPGALLALGDLHAAMGDGEITGSGLEIGGRVTVRTELIRGHTLEWPVVETPEAWYVHGAGDVWRDAVELASREAARLLEVEWQIPASEVPVYLTLAGDLGVCQDCQPSPFGVVARLGVRKSPTVPTLLASQR